jgi:hypothetical protein
MWIMISGPYSIGNTADAATRATNLRRMNEAAVALHRAGHVPVIGVNLALPVIEAAGAGAFEEIMMPLSLALAERCDACLRIGGPSAGADEEAAIIRGHGGQVFHDLKDIPAA